MIDIHSHIMPGIDDGAMNLEETMALIENSEENGHKTEENKESSNQNKSNCSIEFKRTQSDVAQSTVFSRPKINFEVSSKRKSYRQTLDKNKNMTHEINKLESENNDLKQDVYKTKFKCEEDYTLVYYNCIPNEKVNTSGIYFSSKYKFSNLIAYYNKLQQ